MRLILHRSGPEDFPDIHRDSRCALSSTWKVRSGGYVQFLLHIIEPGPSCMAQLPRLQAIMQHSLWPLYGPGPWLKTVITVINKAISGIASTCLPVVVVITLYS